MSAPLVIYDLVLPEMRQFRLAAHEVPGLLYGLLRASGFSARGYQRAPSPPARRRDLYYSNVTASRDMACTKVSPLTDTVSHVFWATVRNLRSHDLPRCASHDL